MPELEKKQDSQRATLDSFLREVLQTEHKKKLHKIVDEYSLLVHEYFADNYLKYDTSTGIRQLQYDSEEYALQVLNQKYLK